MADRKYCGCSYGDLACILDFMMTIENETELDEKELDDYDIAMQCIQEIMERMRDGKPIQWDEEEQQ